jgi:hypothetical protein
LTTARPIVLLQRVRVYNEVFRMARLPTPLEVDKAQRLLLELLNVFTRQGPTGQPAFSEDEIRNCLALLFVMLSQQFSSDSGPGVLNAFASFSRYLGIDANDAPEAASQKIVEHYRKNPVNPALKSQLEQTLREFLQSESGEVEMQKLETLIGSPGFKGALSSGNPRPEGTVPAGPMARFAPISEKKP